MYERCVATKDEAGRRHARDRECAAPDKIRNWPLTALGTGRPETCCLGAMRAYGAKMGRHTAPPSGRGRRVARVCARARRKSRSGTITVSGPVRVAAPGRIPPISAVAQRLQWRRLRRNHGLIDAIAR